MVFMDRVYGKFGIINPNIIELIKHKYLQRLRLVSLSSIPSFCLPINQCANRFEHSIGVSYLSTFLLPNQNYGINLTIASLLHDIGTPPLAHISEHFMKNSTGLTHEQYVRNLVEENKKFKQLIVDTGADIDIVLNLIDGTDLLGHPLNGIIDLDNIDNTYRFGLSTGIISVQKIHHWMLDFDPIEMVKGALFKNGKIYYCPNQTLNMQNIRRFVYENWIYKPVNLACSAMLFRSLELLNKNHMFSKLFFTLNDKEAIKYILISDNPKIGCADLITKILTYDYYEEKTRILYPENDFINLNINCFELRTRLANEICAHFKLELSKVAVYCGLTRTYIVIDDETNNSQNQNHYLVCVYLDPKVKIEQYIMKDFVSNYMHEMTN